MAFGVINLTDTTQTAIATAKSGHKVRVYSYVVKGDAECTCNFQSASTVIGPVYIGAKGDGAVAPPTPFSATDRAAWFETAVGEALNVQLSASANVKGHIEYEYVPAVN